MHTSGDLRGKIVDAALALGEQRSWEAVRLHDVAAELGISLNEVRGYFREKEEIAEAWFDRADALMLEDAATMRFQSLPVHERLHRVIMTWLGALAAHKRVTQQIIFGKMEPGHLHVQIPALLRVSRTVQWFREAAHRDATYVRRALEETVLTSIYLVTFFYWLRDDSEGATRTGVLLDRLLRGAGRLQASIYGDSSERA
ncbi:MAG: TetR family transcriptional regulator [Acidiferrobacterales bacterium]|nr:TetR family transcriptional regulator [Acidiferrobacterales bacterium]